MRTQRLPTSYPELAQTPWGVIEVYDDGAGNHVECLAVRP